uniref:Uncharacterized protein n=1 Tax=Romanomermis culicivorax TaxID=13658 RepID=A0A915HHA9_ROMCU
MYAKIFQVGSFEQFREGPEMPHFKEEEKKNPYSINFFQEKSKTQGLVGSAEAVPPLANVGLDVTIPARAQQ